jgi:small-conductance mechanosensitive channel
VLISLYERLCEADIKIPFPQQDIHIKELTLDYRKLTASVDTNVSSDGKMEDGNGQG